MEKAEQGRIVNFIQNKYTQISPTLNNFFEQAKDTIKYILQAKVLWIFGFIIALFGGDSNNFNFNSFSNSNNQNFNNINFFTENNSDYLKIQKAIQDFVKQPMFWMIVLVGVILVLIFFVVGIYLKNVSRTAITKSVSFEAVGKSFSFKDLFNEGNKYFWKVFILDILYIFSILVLIFVSLLTFCLCCFGLILSIVGGIIIGAIYSFVYKFIVLYDLDLSKAISATINVFKTNTVQVLNFLLVNFFVKLITGICMLIVISIPLVLVIIFAMAKLWIFVACSTLILILLVLGISSILIPFEIVFQTRSFFMLANSGLQKD